MRRLVALYLVLGLLFACAQPRVTSEPRLGAPPTGRADRDRVAKQALLELEFFADGRGLMMVPRLIDVYDRLNQSAPGHHVIMNKLRNDWGFVIYNDAPSGLFRKPYDGFNVGVLGCAVCHSGKAAGIFIPGLGNKNIDVLQIGRDVSWIQMMFTKLQLPVNHSPQYKDAQKFALQFANTINVEKLGNLTQGIVPVSIIQTWFYKQGGIGHPSKMNRGATKVPALWGYATKNMTGKFCDGFGKGPGWLVSIELTAGQKPETVRSYFPKVVNAELIFADLLPPPYPFEKQCSDTMPGKAIFEENCSRCHGTYENDGEGYSIYKPPKFVPINTVKTDADRTGAITPEFEKLVDSNPMNDVIQRNQLGRGYIAPRLEGIWSRFPYLHNASVPSLKAMLTDPQERPTIFSLEDAGEESRFDRTDVGLTMPAEGSTEYTTQKVKAKLGVRNIYYTKRDGQSNQGHSFGTTLPDPDKDALIAYLKCL
jgi:hypothetical protein